nr:hypothetical protein ICEMyc226_00042 [Mycolicibacterium sp.]
MNRPASPGLTWSFFPSGVAGVADIIGKSAHELELPRIK